MSAVKKVPSQQTLEPEANARGKKRLTRAALSGGTSIVRLGVAIVAQLVIIPLASAHLDPERFGLWVSMAALFLWVSLLDLGLPKALINVLCQADGLQDNDLAKSVVSSAFWLQATFLLVPILASEILLRALDLHRFFHISGSISGSELSTCIRVALYLAILNAQFGLARAGYTGFQLGYKATWWDVLGAILPIPAVLVVIHFGGSLLSFTLASLAPLVLGTMGCALSFVSEFPELMPSPFRISRATARRLLKLGAAYLLAQVTSLVMQQSQPWILMSVVGATVVGPFSVAQRLITVPTALLIALVAPLQPAFGEASYTGDWHWVRGMFHKVMIGTAVLSLLSGAGLFFWGKQLMGLLLRQGKPVSSLTFIWLCAYTMVHLLGTPAWVFLYGLERPKGPAIYGSFHGLVLLTLGYWATKAYGSAGLAATMCFSMALTVALPQLVESSVVLRRGRDAGSPARQTHSCLPDHVVLEEI